MTFEQIPIRMIQLGVDREWLSLQCDYTRGSLAAILAPKGNQRHKTPKALRRIWEALDREEARQEEEKAAAAAPPLAMPERQQLVLRPTEDEYEAWSRAQVRVGSPTLRDWAVASLNESAARLSAFTDTHSEAEGKKPA